MLYKTFVGEMALFMCDHLRERLRTEDEFGDIIRMPKPRNKFESWAVWSEINSYLAPEVIAQDGEASEEDQQCHIRMVIGDAFKVFHMGYPCPKEVVAVDDTGYLEQFLEEEK